MEDFYLQTIKVTKKKSLSLKFGMNLAFFSSGIKKSWKSWDSSSNNHKTLKDTSWNDIISFLMRVHLCTFQNESHASISCIRNFSSPPSQNTFPISIFTLSISLPSPTHMDHIKNASPVGGGRQQTSEITFRLDLDLIKTLWTPWAGNIQISTPI